LLRRFTPRNDAYSFSLDRVVGSDGSFGLIATVASKQGNIGIRKMPERTLIIIKPDGVQRHLVGEIVARLERKGLKLVAAKFMQISESLAGRHYAMHSGKSFYEGVIRYLSSSPVLVMVWEAEGVIEIVRKLMGATFGYEAAPGTIRGDLSCSRGYNLIHGSDSPSSAEREIELFFRPEELMDYELAAGPWLYNRKQ